MKTGEIVMALNNWSIASRVRSNGVWNEIPIVSTYFGIVLYTDQLKVFLGGATVSFVLSRWFPPTQHVQMIAAIILTLMMSIYMMQRPNRRYFPEHTNWQLFWKQTNSLRRKRHFKQLTNDDLNRKVDY